MESYIVRYDGFVVERELRGESAYWVHVYGPASRMRQARAIVGAEALKWARELGLQKTRGWISGGSEFSGLAGWARTSYCYSFKGL